jgi:23S rRNA maturation-related 3'-5' exoribonuclease YhaM
MGELELLEKNVDSAIEKSLQLAQDAKREYESLKAHHEHSLRNKFERIPELKAQILAIETALSLHKVKINTNLIQPQYKQKNRGLLPHGALTKSIFKVLEMTDSPISTRDVTQHIISTYSLSLSSSQENQLRTDVAWRLKNLTTQGKLQSLYSETGLGRWVLSDK